MPVIIDTVIALEKPNTLEKRTSSIVPSARVSGAFEITVLVEKASIPILPINSGDSTDAVGNFEFDGVRPATPSHLAAAQWDLQAVRAKVWCHAFLVVLAGDVLAGTVNFGITYPDGKVVRSAYDIADIPAAYVRVGSDIKVTLFDPMAIRIMALLDTRPYIACHYSDASILSAFRGGSLHSYTPSPFGKLTQYSAGQGWAQAMTMFYSMGELFSSRCLGKAGASLVPSDCGGPNVPRYAVSSSWRAEIGKEKARRTRIIAATLSYLLRRIMVRDFTFGKPTQSELSNLELVSPNVISYLASSDSRRASDWQWAFRSPEQPGVNFNISVYGNQKHDPNSVNISGVSIGAYGIVEYPAKNMLLVLTLLQIRRYLQGVLPSPEIYLSPDNNAITRRNVWSATEYSAEPRHRTSINLSVVTESSALIKTGANTVSDKKVAGAAIAAIAAGAGALAGPMGAAAVSSVGALILSLD